ncbi:MAG: NIPSNAP family protein [Chloroflexota bacterium]
MLYELRIYETVPGRLPALHKRFSEVTLKIFERHGIRQAGFWTGEISDNTNNELTYFLAWESLEERERKWGAFQADPEWIEKRAASEADGPIVARVRSSILRPTSYSSVK